MRNPENLPALGLLAAAALLIAVGIAAGQPDDVLVKAVRICMECVGIG